MCLHVCKSTFNFNISDSKRKVLDHIVLTGYSKMNLAVQVLSRTVSTCVFESGDPEVVGTAIFCRMINDFFYCTNVRSRTEHQFKKNQQVKPYSSADDERFVWISETFLTYLGLGSQYCWKRGRFQCNCPRQDVPVTPDL